MGHSSSKSNAEPINWLETPHIVNEQNYKLFCKYWEPKQQTPTAIVYICHGVAEHCQWYENIGSALADEGILAFSHDHVGHGLSEGHRAYIDHFSEYTQAALQHTNMMKKQHPNIPCFIIGHSMGGLIAVRLILDNPDLYSGAVLLAPALKSNPETATWFKVRMAKTVASIMPAMEIGALDPSWMAHDQELVKRYKEDPLVYHGGLRARLAVCLLMEMEAFAKQAEEIKLPIITFHGTQDKITELSGAKLLQEKASSKDKTLQILEDQYHRVQDEANGVGEKCRQDLVKWIVDHIE